jgi:DNA-binding MarR family transcriptional regulator
MSTGALDPLIHDPERLRIVATLAALPHGDTLTVTRLQDMIGLPPGSPIICLRELDRAGYVRTEMTGGDRAQAIVALTCQGRAALDHYTAMLRHLPQAAREDQPPAPHVRAGDADRDAAAAALGEHFAQGRLTLDELDARLDATLTAATHGELSQAARDLPDLTGSRPGSALARHPWPGRTPNNQTLTKGRTRAGGAGQLRWRRLRTPEGVSNRRAHAPGSRSQLLEALRPALAWNRVSSRRSAPVPDSRW